MSSNFGDTYSYESPSSSSDEDYYVILGVDFRANPETIVAAYRQLARKYHPDKHHQNEEKRKEAQIIFKRIKAAYDVLIDPHKRAIYDSVGPEGLKLEGWKLVAKQMTAQDIRNEYQKLVQNKIDTQMLNIAKPRGIFTVAIDASDIFAKKHNHLHFDDELEEESYNDPRFTLPHIEISSMSAAMSVEHSLESNKSIRLNGSVDTKNGTGGGSIGTTYRHAFNQNSYVEVSYQIGKGPLFLVRGSKKIGSKTTLTGSCFFYDWAGPHGIRGTVVHKIKENIVGKIACREGAVSSMTTSLIYINARLSFDVTTSFKLDTDNRNAISLDLGFNNVSQDTKLSLSIALVNEDGLEVEYGIQTKVSEISIIGAALSFSAPSGVSLKIKYFRANQEFNFPIYLADEITSAPIFYGTAIPVVCYQIFQRTYLKKSD